MDSPAGHHKRQRSDDSNTVAKRQRHDTTGLRSQSGLAHLPEEVLLLILETILGILVRCHALVDVLQQVAALHSLCLTNKTFNRLATPYLCAFVSNRNRRRLPQMLDAMILDSKKAAGIKYMSWALNVKRSSQAMCRRSSKAEITFLQKLGMLGIPELAGDLRQCFHGNSPEYQLATALVLAPNLEYLEAADVNYEQETVDGAVWRPTWLELLVLKALSRPAGLAKHFQHLHHLHLSMGELSFEQIGPLLRLPALRTLSLTGGEHKGRVPAQLWDRDVGQRCSTIETLVFENIRVSLQIVAQMLNAILHLKTLKVELGQWPSNVGDPDADEISLAELSEAISKHNESLERLYLIDGGIDPQELGYTLNSKPMECLHDLRNLRYLDTGLLSIPGNQWTIFHDTILPSLEHLVIRVEEYRLYSVDTCRRHLQDLAVNCKLRLPLLQDIVVWLPRESHAFEVDFSACKATFESQGVDILLFCYESNVRDAAGVQSSTWRLHPSTVEASSILGSGTWGCRLQSMVFDPTSTDERARVVLHERCSAYHDPYGWSIIDNASREKS